MKSTTSFVLFGAAALALIAADTLPRTNDLTVHEWGTFTSVAGEDGSAINWEAQGGKNDLPGFVNNRYLCFKSSLTGTVRMETPVLYFYSPREVTANVRVVFPHGAITEWYPNADNAIYESKSLMDQMGAATRSPIYAADAVVQTKSLIDPAPAGLDSQLVRLSPSLNGIDLSMRNLMGAIGWSDIKIQPGSTADFPVEKSASQSASRYYAARGTDAAPITAGDQHEKFLFYRGVGRIPVPLSARISSDGRVVVENHGADTVPSAFLFENGGGRLGYRSAGAIFDQNVVTLDTPSLDGSFSELRHDLETALVAQGLFPKEAQAMVETWRDSWFEEGSRLIYIVPANAIDAMLPLQVDPTPSQTTRVFVGRIELVTAETKRVVKEAFAHRDWPVVARYGRFLDPILERISAESPLAAKQIQQYRGEIPSSIGAGPCR
jgi:hypothetical protein